MHHIEEDLKKHNIPYTVEPDLVQKDAPGLIILDGNKECFVFSRYNSTVKRKQTFLICTDYTNSRYNSITVLDSRKNSKAILTILKFLKGIRK